MTDRPVDVDQLLTRFIDDELEERPDLATALGVDGHDDRLGDLSAAGFARRAAADVHRLDTFGALPDDGLTAEQQLDRDLVVAMLRGRVVMHDWVAWRRNPDTYLNPGLQGVFSLFLYRVRPEPELAAAAAARLRAVPDVLDEGRANLDPELASAVLVVRAQAQARAAVRYTGELLAGEVADPEARDALVEAGEIAAKAFESFADFLDDLAERARGAYAVGETRYTDVLRQRELLDVDSAQLRDRGEALWRDLSAEMEEVTRRIRGNGDGDWKALVRDLNRDHPATPEDMRTAYETWTARARAFLVEHGLVTFTEGEECAVEPSPHFQRPVLAVANYFQPPPFRDSLRGHFFVPFPPDGTPPEEVQQRLESNNNHEIPTVSVHEAYPGHHWHLVTMRGSGRPIRSLLRTPYFAEGWGLYAELMMREQGFFTDPRHELMHLKDRIFRATRIIVDTSLHAGDMTVDEATSVMMDRAGLPEPTARAEVHRYCAWPTQASAYLTGSVEIERLRRRWFDEGRGDLRGFHDAIARLGCMPIALHERGLFGAGG